MYEGRQKINWLKRSYNDIFDNWDPSTATLMKEVSGLLEKLYWKINIIWLHSMRVSWSVCELFNRSSYVTINLFKYHHSSYHIWPYILYITIYLITYHCISDYTITVFYCILPVWLKSYNSLVHVKYVTWAKKKNQLIVMNIFWLQKYCMFEKFMKEKVSLWVKEMLI